MGLFGRSPLLPVVTHDDGTQSDPLLVGTTEEAVAAAAALQFPPGFIFSSATSAYQVEGGIFDTNWNRWEQQKTKRCGGQTIRNGDEAGRACDMWNLFEDVDLPLIEKLGLNSFRFSIEWSRVEPTEGAFDDAALARYERWCRLLRARGIEPCVTLLHFTEPGWFVDQGGWEERQNVPLFVRFCERVVRRLSPYCSMWCTLNEPVGCAVNGWLVGIHPPGGTGRLRATVRVIWHMLLGHREASRAIREAAAPVIAASSDCESGDRDSGERDSGAAGARCGMAPCVMIANNIVWFEARWRWNLVARLVTWLVNLVFNYCVMDLCVRGRLSPALDLACCLLGAREEMRSLEGSVTHIGINNYARVQLGMCGCCFGCGAGQRRSRRQARRQSPAQQLAEHCVTEMAAPEEPTAPAPTAGGAPPAALAARPLSPDATVAAARLHTSPTDGAGAGEEEDEEEAAVLGVSFAARRRRHSSPALALALCDRSEEEEVDASGISVRGALSTRPRRPSCAGFSRASPHSKRIASKEPLLPHRSPRSAATASSASPPQPAALPAVVATMASAAAAAASAAIASAANGSPPRDEGFRSLTATPTPNGFATLPLTPTPKGTPKGKGLHGRAANGASNGAAAGVRGAAGGGATKAACGAKGAHGAKGSRGAKGSCGARSANGAASGGEADMMEAGMVVSGEQSLGGHCIEAGPHNPRFEMSDMEWDLCPSSLGRALRAFWRRYQLPLIVTESGIADGDEHDERRVRYLSGCLRAVHAALADGVDVRGYTYWSLLDNFEWAEGFRPRFGLYRVDYTTLARTETAGLRLLRAVVHRHRRQPPGPKP